MQRTVNLGLHLLNGWLLWWLARAVLSEWSAVLAVGLWWLHPVQTESVAYIASRPELVMAMWILLALIAAESRRPWWALSAAVVAVTGKEMGVVAPVLLAGWAWWRGQTWGAAYSAVWGAVVGLLGLLFLQHAAHFDWIVMMPLGFTAYMLTALGRLLLLVPEALVHHRALTIDPDWAWLTPPVAMVGASVWVVAAGLIWWRRWRFWGMAIAGAVIATLPRLVLPMPDGLHERHLYVPMIGICLAAGSFFGEVS